MKKAIIGVLSLVIVLIFLGNVIAITGSIGNARMILRAEKGDKIEKYILVKNVNDVPLDITLFATGDLEKDIELKEEEFRLEAGEEKKAYFTIEVAKSGTTETRINVKFTPEDGAGVGLSSTVIVIAGDGEVINSGDKNKEGEEGIEEPKENTEETENEGVSVTTGKVTGTEKTNPVAIGLTITAVVFVIFIILLLTAYKKTKLKKRVKRNV